MVIIINKNNIYNNNIFFLKNINIKKIYNKLLKNKNK